MISRLMYLKGMTQSMGLHDIRSDTWEPLVVQVVPSGYIDGAITGPSSVFAIKVVLATLSQQRQLATSGRAASLSA